MRSPLNCLNDVRRRLHAYQRDVRRLYVPLCCLHACPPTYMRRRLVQHVGYGIYSATCAGRLSSRCFAALAPARGVYMCMFTVCHVFYTHCFFW